MHLIKRLNIAAVLMAIVISTPAAFAQKAAKAAAPDFGNVSAITAKQLKDYLTFIASDELEGRDTPSRGLDIAALYLAQHLASWGLKPAGDNGTYFQKFPLKHTKIVSAETRMDIAGQPFEYGKDFLSSITAANIANAGFVFAGNGWVIKSKNIDPYQGVNVKDKIVIVVNALPKGITFQDLKGPVGQDWSSPAFYAQTNG